MADSKGGRWGRPPPPLLASEIFPQTPCFIYSLAYTLAVGTASVMCKYIHGFTHSRAADSITIALPAALAGRYQLQRSADAVQLKSALVIQGSRF